MKRIATLIATALAAAGIMLAVPASAAVNAPAAAHARLDHLAAGSRCLTVTSAIGLVTVQRCNWSNRRQLWRPISPAGATSNRIVTVTGRCLAAVSRSAVAASRCDRSTSQQWLTVAPVAASIIQSARYPSLCLAGPTTGPYGAVRLVNCASSAPLNVSQDRRSGR